MRLRECVLAGCLLCLVSWLWLPGTLAAQPRDLAYVLEVAVHPERHELEGSVLITLTNPSSRALTEVALQLYPNAFANRRTVFMREGGLELRGVPFERAGGLELVALESEQGDDLLASSQRELIEGDKTQLVARLPRAIEPGARLAIRARFRTRLPSLVARMGQAGDFCMIAQWFPKLARLRADGSWASKPYHGLGEFDADFADYTLTVSVPRAHVIAAPGKLLESRTEGARKIERYQLEGARDLALATSPQLERYARRTRSGIQVDVYAPPGSAAIAARQAALLERGLRTLSARLGAYPYERLVLVLPPFEARGAAGMEYAGLIVGFFRAPFPALGRAEDALHDIVTTHELAHQWFPMLISNDEVEEPVLDEGLAQWLGLELLRAEYGRGFFERWLGLSFDLFSLARARVALRPGLPSSLSPVHALRPSQLAGAIYLRPAAVLEQLAQRHGREPLFRAFSTYAHRHRFAHATLRDLENAFDAAYGPGFAAQQLIPALGGTSIHAVPAAEQESSQEPRSASAVFSRVLSLAQAVLAWSGP